MRASEISLQIMESVLFSNFNWVSLFAVFLKKEEKRFSRKDLFREVVLVFPNMGLK